VIKPDLSEAGLFSFETTENVVESRLGYTTSARKDLTHIPVRGCGPLDIIAKLGDASSVHAPDVQLATIDGESNADTASGVITKEEFIPAHGAKVALRDAAALEAALDAERLC
jgi:hypothetical protein